MSMPLLSTKLSAKPPRADFVPRPHLVERLNQGAKQKLTLICAPAGFGKSTLVSIWAQQATNPVTWLELDAGDNDPTRFLAYLVAACEKGAPYVGPMGHDILASFELTSLAYPLTLLINKIVQQTRPFSLVLDDYHLISNPIIHNGVSFLLSHLPAAMRLLIVSRQTPPLPLSRLRVRGQVTEIDATELRFNQPQTSLFFSQTMGLQITSDAVSTLFARTEGWVASLQLVALSLQKHTSATGFIEHFGGSNRLVYDYLAEEVMQQQGREIGDFLRQTAILDQLNASLCNALTGQDNSQALLAQLEQANLFLIPLDDKRQWYRYHHLFADFLRTQLEYPAALHQKAAQWYASNGFTRQAIPHALAAEAFSLAIELILEVDAEMLGSNSEMVTLLNWVNALPEQFIRASYELSTTEGWKALLLWQIDRAASYAQSAKDVAPPAQADYPALTALRADLALVRRDVSKAIKLSIEGLEEGNLFFRNALLNALGEAMWLSGETEKAAKHFRQVTDLKNRMSLNFAAYGALWNLASLLHLQGKRQEAIRLAQQRLSQFQATFGPQSSFAGPMHLVLGRAYYEAHQLIKAESHLVTGLELSLQLRQYLAPGVTLIGYAIYAQLQQATKRYHDALSTLQEAEQLSLLRPDIPFVRWIKAIAAKVHLQQGHIAEALHWAQGAKFSFERHPEYMLENEHLIYARVLLAQNKLAQAQTLLAQLQQSAYQIGFKARLIIIHTLQARAFLALGDTKQALTTLSCAIRLAAPNHYRRIFIEESKQAPAIANLLPQVRHIAPTFVSSLLQFLPNQPILSRHSPSRSPNQPSNAPITPPLERTPLRVIEPLSERELEVLQLIAQGFTNQQIADHLFLSLSTVKWHTRNIYGKMGVRKRTQAVARARELSLL
ncbi:MAG: LuxR C-terminal-related transcriptional regulator [Ardenticatenaceae bacterium]